ncbi:MAG: 16S rRNA (guanine(527)-N(7))-methyltransferase RsmG [Deltaproteobacteria bacterium]|jgi:16S rRNA (guanine527-N7)-methyltransferase|nr:16S rRNA (guanine(527)-N(7))-methyltransferase RsmG [Deltaproteobacteria bacterium]
MQANLADMVAKMVPPVQLTDDQLGKLVWLVDELLRWNRKRNLTAITRQSEIYEKHLIDSLTLLPFLGRARSLLDIGSGAGFPALPLKIARADLEVFSLDAVAKKVAFQRHVARTLGLHKFLAVHGRAEDLPSLQDVVGRVDLVTARAVGQLGMLADLAKPYVIPGGRLLAMKGPEGHDEKVACGDGLEKSGWKVFCHELVLPVSGARRCVVEMVLKNP